MYLYFIVLEMMLALVPSDRPYLRHGLLAVAITETIESERPLFGDTHVLSGRVRTAALLVAVSFRESSLRNEVTGDHGRSFCAFQIHESSGGTSALLEDPRACVRAAYLLLRQSISIDRIHPVAFYARGPRFASEEARRISNDRMALQKRLADGSL